MVITSAARLPAAALAALLLVAGCQPAASTPTSIATAQATAASSPSAVATAEPSIGASAPGPTSADGAREMAGIRSVMPAGLYTRRGFEPRITFRVDGPWKSAHALVDFFDIEQLIGTPEVIAVQFAKPDGIYGATDTPVPPTTAEAAVATIRLNGRIEVVESSDSRIGGLTGLQITVENPAAATGDRAIIHVPAGPLAISPARRLWLAFFDTPDGLLTIMVGGSVAKWGDALTAAEPVLESITIGK
jgi:hypothetical protein